MIHDCRIQKREEVSSHFIHINHQIRMWDAYSEMVCVICCLSVQSHTFVLVCIKRLAHRLYTGFTVTLFRQLRLEYIHCVALEKRQKYLYQRQTSGCLHSWPLRALNGAECPISGFGKLQKQSRDRPFSFIIHLKEQRWHSLTSLSKRSACFVIALICPGKFRSVVNSAAFLGWHVV